MCSKDKYGIRDAYKDYKTISDEPVSVELYVQITSEFFKFLMNKMLSGLTVKLPSKLGEILIMGNKTKMRLDESGEIKGFPPDWKETKKLWERCPECKEKKQLVYHLNEATAGVRYKMYWAKKSATVENKSLYSLQFTRENTRTTSNLIKNGKEYFVK